MKIKVCVSCNSFYRLFRWRFRVRRVQRWGRWWSASWRTLAPRWRPSCSAGSGPARCWGCWRGRCRDSGRRSRGTCPARSAAGPGSAGTAPGWWSSCSWVWRCQFIENGNESTLSTWGRQSSGCCSCRWGGSCRGTARTCARAGRSWWAWPRCRLDTSLRAAQPHSQSGRAGAGFDSPDLSSPRCRSCCCRPCSSPWAPRPPQCCRGAAVRPVRWGPQWWWRSPWGRWRWSWPLHSVWRARSAAVVSQRHQTSLDSHSVPMGQTASPVTSAALFSVNV